MHVSSRQFCERPEHFSNTRTNHNRTSPFRRHFFDVNLIEKLSKRIDGLIKFVHMINKKKQQQFLIDCFEFPNQNILQPSTRWKCQTNNEIYVFDGFLCLHWFVSSLHRRQFADLVRCVTAIGRCLRHSRRARRPSQRTRAFPFWFIFRTSIEDEQPYAVNEWITNRLRNASIRYYNLLVCALPSVSRTLLPSSHLPLDARHGEIHRTARITLFKL